MVRGPNAAWLALLPALMLAGHALAQAVILKESEQKTEREAAKQAGKAASPFSLEVSAGLESDSNVSVSELDESTGEDDQAAVLDADLDYELTLGKLTELQFGYGLSQTSYDDFSAYDVQNHLLTADFTHDFGAIDAGAAYRYIHTRLGGHDYLAIQQLAPSASRFFGRKFFGRAEYTFSDKAFDEVNERDATTHAGGADLYWFVNGVRTYVVFGYRYRNENAEDAQYDYDSHNLKLRLSQRFRFLEHDATLKLGWLYEQRDYSAPTPAIDATRDDDRNRFQAELELPLGRQFFGLLDYEYGAFSSNLQSADYDQHVVSVRLGLKI